MPSFQQVNVIAYMDDNRPKLLGSFTTAVVKDDSVVVFPGNYPLLKREVVPARTEGKADRITWRLFNRDGNATATRYTWFEITTVSPE